MARDHDTDLSHVSNVADSEEAAAIIVAVSAYLRNEDRVLFGMDADADSMESWTGKRWTFAGRLEEQKLRSRRVPLSAPVDAWTAAGRRDRY